MSTNTSQAGVKTPEGKAISKYNAVRHGVLVQVLTGEESEEAQFIDDQFMADYNPSTLTEELLIETMTIAYTRRQRAVKAEKDFMLQVLNPAVWEEKVIIPPLLKPEDDYDRLQGKKEVVIVKEGHKAKITYGEIDLVESKFARYITTCERQFYRALHELQRIQSLRKGVKPYSMAVDFMGDRQSED